MLMCVWEAWYQAMPRLHAEERLAAFEVGQLADSGWKIDDRQRILEEWRAATRPGRLKPLNLRAQMTNLKDRMLAHFGGGIR